MKKTKKNKKNKIANKKIDYSLADSFMAIFGYTRVKNNEKKK